MKKHITQAAIDELAKGYHRAYNRMSTDVLNGNQAAADIEYNVLVAYTTALSILTGQEYDAARMMLRKRAGII